MLTEVRVSAEAEVLVKESPDQQVSPIIQARSKSADLTFMGIKVPAADETESYGDYLDKMVQGIGTVMLVRSVQHEGVLDTG